MREDYVTPTVEVTLELMERYRIRKAMLKLLNVNPILRCSEAMDRMALAATDLAWSVMLAETIRHSRIRRDHCSGGPSN